MPRLPLGFVQTSDPPIASSWAYNARTLDCPSHSLLLGLQCKDPRIASSWASYKDPRASYKHPLISKIKYPRRLDIFHLYARSISFISSQTINQSNFLPQGWLINQTSFLPQGWLINQTVLPPYWLINQSFCHKADFIETFATRLADESKIFVTRLTSLKVFATRLVKQQKHLYHSKRHK